MLRKNRVFFSSQLEAICEGFRPCAKCMPEEYAMWKKESKKKKYNHATWLLRKRKSRTA